MKFIRSAAMAVLLCVAVPFSASAEQGKASWYQLTSKTASGQMMNPEAMTAAHKRLPFGTIVRVSANNRHVTVCINDRGPYARGRIIDLSRASARQLGIIDRGHQTVNLQVVGRVKYCDNTTTPKKQTLRR